jgi:hypothetical protein
MSELEDLQNQVNECALRNRVLQGERDSLSNDIARLKSFIQEMEEGIYSGVDPKAIAKQLKIILGISPISTPAETPPKSEKRSRKPPTKGVLF